MQSCLARKKIKKIHAKRSLSMSMVFKIADKFLVLLLKSMLFLFIVFGHTKKGSEMRQEKMMIAATEILEREGFSTGGSGGPTFSDEGDFIRVSHRDVNGEPQSIEVRFVREMGELAGLPSERTILVLPETEAANGSADARGAGGAGA